MPAINTDLDNLRAQILRISCPNSTRETALAQINRLAKLAGGDLTIEADRTVRWVEWIVALPWNTRAEGSLDLVKAREILDQEHYGLTDAKQRILEYLAVLKLRLTQSPRGVSAATSATVRAPIIFLVGLVGTGKTTLAYSIAKSLGRPIVRIPFGGMGSARDLRGQSRLHPEAEPGQLIKAIRQVGVKNPVMLLDELDRVADDGRHDIMGVLVELLDPEQNKSFLDHYLDVPFDLSEVLFIATANNTTNIAIAVLDRLDPISMPSYSDQEKIIIGKKYLLPRAAAESAIPAAALVIDEEVWPLIVRPLGFDAGTRTLQRTIQHLTRMAAMKIVSGDSTGIHITAKNIKEYVQPW